MFEFQWRIYKLQFMFFETFVILNLVEMLVKQSRKKIIQTNFPTGFSFTILLFLNVMIFCFAIYIFIQTWLFVANDQFVTKV